MTILPWVAFWGAVLGGPTLWLWWLNPPLPFMPIERNGPLEGDDDRRDH